jgi:hypothetical protein
MVITLAAGLTSLQDESVTASDVHLVVTTNGSSGSSGVGQSNGDSRTVAETPVEKLKNALSSKEKFEQNYLVRLQMKNMAFCLKNKQILQSFLCVQELCELGMGTYKHIGRIRSARKVGLALAAYYVEGGAPGKAVPFLLDALTTYRADRSPLLALDTLLRLAEVYHALEDTHK